MSGFLLSTNVRKLNAIWPQWSNPGVKGLHFRQRLLGNHVDPNFYFCFYFFNRHLGTAHLKSRLQAFYKYLFNQNNPIPEALLLSPLYRGKISCQSSYSVMD